jgi:hypothetical protein
MQSETCGLNLSRLIRVRHHESVSIDFSGSTLRVLAAASGHAACKMDELAELQALLGAVQKQEVKYRLNERNCKELLVKLIEKSLVELIVTLVRLYTDQ